MLKGHNDNQGPSKAVARHKRHRPPIRPNQNFLVCVLGTMVPVVSGFSSSSVLHVPSSRSASLAQHAHIAPATLKRIPLTNPVKVSAVPHPSLFRAQSHMSTKRHHVSRRATSSPVASPVEVPSEQQSVATEDPDESGEKLGMSPSVVNLVKACVGSGVLALPAGVAAIGDVPAALLPASGLIMFLGALSAYSFFMLGRLCHFANEGRNVNGDGNGGTTRTRSLGDLWAREVGPKSAWIVSLSCVLMTLGAALAYSIILGDLFSSLARTVGVKGLLATRQASILAVTLAVLYPLCNLKSLAALVPMSILGVIGVLLTSGFMGLRSTPGGPYSLPNGRFLASVPPELRPSFGVVGTSKVFSPSALVLGSMAAISYLVHFSAPDFYNELKNNTLKRFGSFTALGFAGVALVNIIMMCFGFLTFGGACSGVILNNYSYMDVGASLCRLLMGVCVIGSFPFMFRAGLRNFFQLTQNGNEVSDDLNAKMTRIVLGALTGLSLIVKDAGFAISINGALTGSAIIYVFPSIIYLKSTARRVKEGRMIKSKRVHLERSLNKFLIAFGVGVGIVGAVVSVVDSFFPGVL